MINYYALAEEIYGILAAPAYDFDLKLYDEQGDITATPKNTRWIYINPQDMTVRLPKGKNTDEVIIWKNEEIHDDLIRELRDRLGKAANLYGVKLTIKDFARKNAPKETQRLVNKEKEEVRESSSPLSYTDIDNCDCDDAQDQCECGCDQENQECQCESLNEGMHGNSRRSYWSLNEARMTVIHSKVLNEDDLLKNGARSRNIKNIFVENRSTGERIRMPGTYTPAAKALTRHIDEQGKFTDSLGQKIIEMAQDYQYIKEYLRECNSSMKFSAKNRLRDVRSSCNCLQKKRCYQSMKDSYSKDDRIGKERLMEQKNKIREQIGLTEDTDEHPAIDVIAKQQIRERDQQDKELKRFLSRYTNKADEIVKCILNSDYTIDGKLRKQPSDILGYAGIASDLATKVSCDKMSLALVRIADQIESTGTVTKGQKFCLNKIIQNAGTGTEFFESDKELEELQEFVTDLN